MPSREICLSNSRIAATCERYLIRTAVALSLVMGAFALAQQASAEPNQPPAAPAADEGQLQEIIVTAQFRSQNLQQTPLAITAVTADMMEARSQNTVLDVANGAPSVTLSLAGGGLGGSQATSVTIRGIGQNDFDMALEPGVGMYLDDVYYGIMYGSLFDLIDLDRVEILRGPQGTLSGKNSEGGAVKLYSKQPGPTNDAYVEATDGSHGLKQVRAGTNFTLIPDRLFLRVTGVGEQQNGFVTRFDYQCATGQQAVRSPPPAPYFAPPSMEPGGPTGCALGTEGGKSVVAVRAALRYLVTDDIEDTLTADSTRDRSDPPPTVLFYQGSWHGAGYNLLSSPPAPVLAQNFVPPVGSYFNYAAFTGLAGTPNQYTLPAVDAIDAWGVSNVLDAKLPAALSLKSITAVRNLHQSSVEDADASPVEREMNLWAVDYHQFTEELRLNGTISSWMDWTLGGFYFRSNALQGGRISLDGAADNLAPFFIPVDFLFNDPVHSESKSSFLHTEFHATDALSFTAGVRYTSDYKSYKFVRYFPASYTPSPIDLSIAATNGNVGVYRGNHIDYRGTVAYQIDPHVNVYAEVATGFKGGGINGRPYYAEQVLPVAPETVKSYEMGIKSDLFDRHVRLNVAAFYNNYSAMQLVLSSCPQYVPAGEPQNCAMPANVGDATIKGAELEAELHLIGDLLIDSSVSYLDFKFSKVDPATGVTLNDKPPFTPKYKLNAGIQYDFPLGGHGSLTPRFDYQYQAEEFSEILNAPHGRIAPYGLANFRLTYRDPSDQWEIAARVTNAFAKYHYLTTVDSSYPVNNPASYDFASAIVGAPREWAVTVKRRF